MRKELPPQTAPHCPCHVYDFHPDCPYTVLEEVEADIEYQKEQQELKRLGVDTSVDGFKRMIR